MKQKKIKKKTNRIIKIMMINQSLKKIWLNMNSKYQKNKKILMSLVTPLDVKKLLNQNVIISSFFNNYRTFCHRCLLIIFNQIFNCKRKSSKLCKFNYFIEIWWKNKIKKKSKYLIMKRNIFKGKYQLINWINGANFE